VEEELEILSEEALAWMSSRSRIRSLCLLWPWLGQIDPARTRASADGELISCVEMKSAEASDRELGRVRPERGLEQIELGERRRGERSARNLSISNLDRVRRMTSFLILEGFNCKMELY
jgi:hypothetical protein